MSNFLVNDKEMQSRDWLIDAGVALAAFAFGCLQLALSSSSIIVTDETFRQMIGVINSTPSPSAYAAMLITTVPLVLRRQYSWLVFIFVMLAFLVLQDTFRGYSFTIIGPAVALYTIARERSRNETIAATVLAVVLLFLVMFPAQNASLSLFLRLQNASYLLVAAFAGYAIRSRQEYLDEVEQRALAAEKSREEEAARRVEEERVRIAREIHDITAHSLSAVSIQAAAAERLISKDPKAAETAIKTVRATAKDALEEIRSMIGFLRQKESNVEMAPTSGTDRMNDLVDYLEQTGIQVEYTDKDYDRTQVASYIDIALFGIAREAVTNIVRHAQAQHVSIVLKSDLESGKAQLLVNDDGVGGLVQAADAADEFVAYAGHGIQGMRERVHVLGGSIQIGSIAEGGFSVRVSIPLFEVGRYHG